MEVRIIKTCHGWQELRLLDGAVLPPDVNPIEVKASSKITKQWEILHKYLKLALWPPPQGRIVSAKSK